MSLGHATITIEGRTDAIQKIKQELQGRLPQGPFEFSLDLEFAELDPAEGDLPVEARLKAAIQRDAKHASAGAVYLRSFGLSQSMRNLYDGGRQIIDGGVTK